MLASTLEFKQFLSRLVSASLHIMCLCKTLLISYENISDHFGLSSLFSFSNSKLCHLNDLQFHTSFHRSLLPLISCIGSLNCGYAKLQEARRMMSYFRQSGKKIIGYCSGGAEKELYFALGTNRHCYFLRRKFML